MGWKFVVAMIVASWLVSKALSSQGQETMGWYSTVVVAAVNVLMFWRIGHHLDLLVQETH